ncbi:MAG: class I tRNA ligase family protein [Candidatus Liptonbacteria bacterium]|nr:class I tRNA ligase family protein [Candidatus Liptonbacteria bacterium]
MDHRYDHKEVEGRIYKAWEESGYFNPDNLPVSQSSGRKAKSFAIIMPPPNANGSLHVGHALFVTLQDIMTRFRRMQGYKTLWLPGADHAGFETQIVYEKELEKEGRSRFNMKPEDLYKEILEFTLENKKYMENQLRALGASCDWSREKFTLDPDIIEKTQATFKKMYGDGLVYRGKRVINWCAKHQTSLSDVETEFKEKIDPFYYFQYGPFVIGTARPETKFGDKYVVTHPDDARYKKYKDGEKIELEWINGKITATVIKDKAIDMEFGTGAMTITPWHDAIDFDIAERHGLDKEQIIDKHGKLLPIAGEFAGMKTEEARPKIVEKLKEKGLLVKVDEKYEHAVRVCYKCERPIEPQIMDQWFVKMRPLADLALKAVADKKIKFIPERFEKIFTYWMENTLDWNISRQIVWGIPIPAYFCMNCGEPRIDAKIKSRWFLVRHGETDWNKEGRYQGHTDIPLNETGMKQAHVAAEQLRNKGLDLIISSDLKRASQTADIIGKTLNIEVIHDARLREVSGGVAEGLTREERPQELNKILSSYDRRPENGESWQDAELRVAEAIAHHKSNHAHHNIAIVTHGGVMRTARKIFKNLSFEEARLYRAENLGVLEFEISENPCKKCGGNLYEKDTDTFDTWFSSGQWPLITLGFPDGKDFKTFYPTDVMETAYDLIFRWVPRMVFFGLYLANEVPFRTVYLHGLVNDARGKKMSKSKGNVMNPLDMTEKYGTDALRMALIVGNPAGSEMALSEDKIRGYRNFSTKIWNVARFVLANKPVSSIKYQVSSKDEKDLEELSALKKEVGDHIETFEFHLAAEKLYHYFWHTFADKIIEEAKPRLKSEDEKDKVAAYAKLETILLECLKMLHPFVPFVTEEIYQKFRPGKMLMIEK